MEFSMYISCNIRLFVTFNHTHFVRLPKNIHKLMHYKLQDIAFSGTIKVFTECHESSSLSIFTVLKLTVVGKTNLRNRRSVISIKSCGKVIFIILMKKEINWLIWITGFYDSIAFLFAWIWIFHYVRIIVFSRETRQCL